jgi:hypothetical protein
MGDSFSMTSNVLELIGKFESVRAGMEGVGTQMKAQVAAHIIEVMPSNMNFMNPSGVLEGSFFYDGNSVTSDVPYAHRREQSFKGPDSLGRMFPNDPASWYMRDTLQQVTTDGSINNTFFSLMDTLTGGGG